MFKVVKTIEKVRTFIFVAISFVILNFVNTHETGELVYDVETMDVHAIGHDGSILITPDTSSLVLHVISCVVLLVLYFYLSLRSSK